PTKLCQPVRAGLPIAAADLPDMKAVVEELGVGEVFQGSSSRDLAEALRAILHRPGRYQAAARAAAPHLTWEQETDQMLEMYRGVLGAQGRGRSRRSWSSPPGAPPRWRRPVAPSWSGTRWRSRVISRCVWCIWCLRRTTTAPGGWSTRASRCCGSRWIHGAPIR